MSEEKNYWNSFMAFGSRYLFLLSIAILMGCSQPEINSTEINDVNYYSCSPEFIHADSLMQNWHLESAIEAYEKHLTSDYALDQLEIIVKYAPWTQEVIHEQTKLKLRKRRTQLPESFTVNCFFDELHSCLASIDYYSEVDYIQDSCMLYASRAFALIEQNQKSNFIQFVVYKAFIKVAEYQRNSILALGLENEFLSQYQITSLEDPFYWDMILIRIISLLKLGKHDLAAQQFELVENNLNHRICHYNSWQYTQFKYVDAINNPNSIYSLKTLDAEIASWNQECNVHSINFYRPQGQGLEYNKQPKEAELFFISAKKFEDTQLYPDIGNLNMITYSLSNIYEQLGKYEKAKSIYMDNYPKFKNTFEKNIYDEFDNINEFISLERIADIYAAKGLSTNNKNSLIKAIDLYSASLDMVDLALSHYNEETLLQYLNYQTRMHEASIKCAFKLYQLTKSRAFLKTIAKHMRGKNNLLFYHTKRLSAINFQREVRFSKKEREIRIKEALKDSTLSSKNLLKLSLEEIKLQEKFNKQIAEPANIFNWYNSFNLEALEVPTIYYAFVNDQLYIHYTVGKSQNVDRLDLSQKDLNNIKKLIKVQSNQIELEPLAYEDLAHQIFNFIIPDSLKNKTNVIIYPDGLLNHLSFDALIKQDVNSRSYARMDYWIKDCTIKQTFANENTVNKIQFDNRIHAYAFSDPASLQENSGHRLEELPFSFKEVESIKRTIPETKVFKGPDCTKANFLNSLASKQDIVHLAVHGVSNTNTKDDLKLFFKDSGKLDSLFAYEILNTKINANTIILSSCESADGMIESREGIYNWPRYLLQQGAQQVITSNWDLNDYAAAELFDDYYQNGFNLRNAKLNLLERGGELAHPFYWAGLIAY